MAFSSWQAAMHVALSIAKLLQYYSFGLVCVLSEEFSLLHRTKLVPKEDQNQL